MPRKKKETPTRTVVEAKVHDKNAEDTSTSTQVKTLGDILSTARRRKKLDVADVARILCIKPVYIEALEQGHYDVFPAKAYTLGFLRTYAQYLKLDQNEMVTLFNQESTELKEKPLEMIVVERHFSVPSKKTLLWLLVILFVFYIMWYLIASSFAPNTIIDESFLEDQKTATLDETVNTPATEAVAETPVPQVEDKKIEEEVVNQISEDVYAAPVALVAKDRVWVRITNEKTEKILLDKTFNKYEHYIPSKNTDVEQLLLSTGKNKALDLYLDGKYKKTLKKEDETSLIDIIEDDED